MGQRCMELADSIEEIKTTCSIACCNKKGILNLKSVNGRATLDGPTVCLGCEEMYVPACYTHFVEKIVGESGKDIDFEAVFEMYYGAASSPPRGSSEPDQELSPQKA